MKLTLHTRCLSYCLLLLLALFQLNANAQVKVYDNFEYTPGANLTGLNGGLGFAGSWTGASGAAVINANNLDGNTLGGSTDLSGGNAQRFRSLNATINNVAGTFLWVGFSYKVTAAQEYSGLSLFNDNLEHVYIGKTDNDLIAFGGGSATRGGTRIDQPGTVNVTDIHYYLAKIDFLGGSDIKVSLWADYAGSTAPDETDLTFQTVAYYNNAAAITRIRLAGSCPGAGASANFDGLRLSSTFFEKSNYTLVSSDVTPPSVPTGLASSNITDNAFTLSWTASTDNVGVAGYDVFKDGVYHGSSVTTTLNITGLSPLTTYSFTVKAKDAVANISATSAALSVTTLDAVIDLIAPTEPTALASSGITANGFTLSWTASTDDIAVTGYDIYKNGVLAGSTATTSYNATGLTGATTYSYTVKAKDAGGNESLESAPLSVTTATGVIVPQVTAKEKFQYAPGNLDGANGGTGFSGPWAVSKGINIEAGDLTPIIGSPTGKVRFVDSDPRGFRDLSKTYTDEAGKVYWIEFSMQGTKKGNSGQGNGIDSMGIDWGGISLFDGGTENAYLGKDGNFGVGIGDSRIDNALYGANHYLVKLVMSGNNNKETAYMWVNYVGATEPAIFTANITTTAFGQDSRLTNFNRIRLAGGGAYGTVPDIAFDNIGVYESYPAAVQSVLVSPATASVAIGAAQQLNATITPANASNTLISWSSSNEAVATVSSTGLVTGIDIGTVNITATTADGNKTSSASITVTAAIPQITAVEKFEHTPGNLDATNGGTGFSGPWVVSKGISIEAGDLTSIAGTPAGKARFVTSDPLGFRDLNKTYTDEAGKIYWIEFSMKGTKKGNTGQGNGIDSMGIDWGGISLFNGGTENGYLGKDGDFGVGLGDARIENALYGAHHYLVKLVMSGDNSKETAYMWLNYTGATEPAIGTANLTTTAFGQDSRLTSFNRIRLAGGGAYGTVPDIAFDDIRISESFQSFGTLPVTLVSFNATALRNGYKLTWKTSAELNTIKFLVERKDVSGVFKEIGVVAASKNENGSNYQFYDANPLIGNNYYRLKIVDADGRFTYSPIINIGAAISGAGIAIYPNPVNNGIVNIVAGTEPIKSISVINIAGTRMMNINVQSALRNVPVNVGTLSKGVYIFEIITPSSVVRKKVIIE